MTLLKLQQMVSKGYAHGDGMGDYFDHETGQPTTWHAGDSLEWFVHVEIAETFDTDLSDEDQRFNAVNYLENSIADLQGAIDSLMKGDK